MFFGYGYYLFLAGLLLLVRIPLVETRAVLFLVHLDIGIEGLPFLVHHILQIKRATTVQCLTLLVGEFQPAEFAWCALLLRVLLPFLQALLVLEDELNAFLFGIDLQGSIEGLTTLGSHSFHFHGFALYKVFVLCIGKRNTLDFFGDVHTVGTQSNKLIGLWVNGNVCGKWLTILGCNLNGLAKIARGKELFFLVGRELVSHIGEVELWLFAEWMNCQADITLAIGTECQTGIGVDGGITHRDGNGYEITLLPVEHFGQLSALLQSLTGKSKVVELLPVNL